MTAENTHKKQSLDTLGKNSFAITRNNIKSIYKAKEAKQVFSRSFELKYLHLFGDATSVFICILYTILSFH